MVVVTAWPCEYIKSHDILMKSLKNNRPHPHAHCSFSGEHAPAAGSWHPHTPDPPHTHWVT